MDDVNMSSLICEEDITKELQQFDVKGEDKEILAKLKNICLIYDFTAEKLVSEWLGFCNKKTWSSDLDLTKIELFEDEGFRQEKLKIEGSKEETKFPNNDKATFQLDSDMLNEYGVMITDDEMKHNEQPNNESVNNVNHTNGGASINDELTNVDQVIEQIDQSNGEDQKSNGQLVTNGNRSMNCIQENKLNESVELGDNRLQNHFGKLLSVPEWMNSDKSKFEIEPLNRELHITKAYKTAQIKAHEANEILNESIDEAYEILMSKLGEEAGGLGDTLFIGRVNLENASDAKDRVLLLENPRLFQRKLKLDLSRVTNYSMFPGKIVCFEGEIQPESSNLFVNKFFDSELLLPPFYQTPIKAHRNPIFLMIASGPIAPSMSDDLSTLEHLLEQVKIYQPHFLVLLGPFFDCRNDYLLFNCDGENFFNKIMRMISSALDNLITQAIIVPSTFDLNNYNIFPAPPFEHSYWNIQFMPNPSFLNLNGIIISISSVDIIRHITREEIRKTDSNDPDRICEHLLIQKNLYPLYPPNQEVNLEYSKLDFIKFNVRPHLFIIPSMIKNFVKNVHGSLFINPEYISKGVFAKVRIDNPPENHIGSIANCTRIEIVKNKSK